MVLRGLTCAALTLGLIAAGCEEVADCLINDTCETTAEEAKLGDPCNEATDCNFADSGAQATCAEDAGGALVCAKPFVGAGCKSDQNCARNDVGGTSVQVDKCQSGVCVEYDAQPLGGACADNTDCELAAFCNDGVCADSLPGGSCANLTDCPLGDVCSDGVCVLGVGASCSSHLDCGVAQFCSGGACAAAPAEGGNECVDLSDCAAPLDCFLAACG